MRRDTGQRNVLIEDGILVVGMQDKLNARLTDVALTGNGRRESCTSPNASHDQLHELVMRLAGYDQIRRS